MNAREVKEWIGRTPDSKPPASVLLRILRRDNFTCYLSGKPILDGMKWHAEHVIPLWKGGENRESNLRPALVSAHKIKTAREAAERAKENAQAKAAFGLKRAPTRPLQGRPFTQSERAAERKARASMKTLPARKVNVYGQRIEDHKP